MYNYKGPLLLKEAVMYNYKGPLLLKEAVMYTVSFKVRSYKTDLHNFIDLDLVRYTTEQETLFRVLGCTASETQAHIMILLVF